MNITFFRCVQFFGKQKSVAKHYIHFILTHFTFKVTGTAVCLSRIYLQMHAFVRKKNVSGTEYWFNRCGLMLIVQSTVNPSLDTIHFFSIDFFFIKMHFWGYSAKMLNDDDDDAQPNQTKTGSKYCSLNNNTKSIKRNS